MIIRNSSTRTLYIPFNPFRAVLRCSFFCVPDGIRKCTPLYYTTLGAPCQVFFSCRTGSAVHPTSVCARTPPPIRPQSSSSEPDPRYAPKAAATAPYIRSDQQQQGSHFIQDPLKQQEATLRCGPTAATSADEKEVVLPQFSTFSRKFARFLRDFRRF